LLLEKDYEVHGTVPVPAAESPPSGAQIHPVDLSDGSNLAHLFDAVRPDEVYHLAAQSDVRLSFDLPVNTADITGVGALRVLEAVRQFQHRSGHQVRFYQASSSEMYGRVDTSPQNEHTHFHPRSPYACAKVFAYWQTINYREAHGLFACNGILFNHESPRRPEKFVTRKISRAAARIKLGLEDQLVLGNLDARRDWGYARDYVQAMWLMLQAAEPDDYVIATGVAHSIRELLDVAFAHVELDWHEFVEVDPALFRPAEVDVVCGDATKARLQLGWQPTVTFEELVRLMVDHDLELAQREIAARGAEASARP
jgi:GDPmannose 4,6-dehydratase